MNLVKRKYCKYTVYIGISFSVNENIHVKKKIIHSVARLFPLPQKETRVVRYESILCIENYLFVKILWNELTGFVFPALSFPRLVYGLLFWKKNKRERNLFSRRNAYTDKNMPELELWVWIFTKSGRFRKSLVNVDPILNRP